MTGFQFFLSEQATPEFEKQFYIVRTKQLTIMLRPSLLMLLLACLCTRGFCGGAPLGKERKFGDVTPDDFAPRLYAVDSSASAVYLFDVGASTFDGNNQGFFSIIYKKHARIRLLKNTSFSDLATVFISLYQSPNLKQEITELQAATYSLENGKVVTVKIDKSALFVEKQGNNRLVKKFTFPSVTEGCIIEFSYKLTTPSYFYLDDWNFQGSYPRLWSQYEVTIPSLFDFVFLKQGYQPYAIDTARVDFSHYSILEPGSSSSDRSQLYTWSGNSVNSIWAMKDVPSIKNEGFLTTLDNHISRIAFQFSALRMPNQPVKNYMRGWVEAAKELMKDEDFGLHITEGNGWLDDECKRVCAGARGDEEKARKLFAYVRDNFECTRHSGKYTTAPLKKTFQLKKGNVADLNLLLTAMLVHVGLNAVPVILSTRDNGVAIIDYPLLDRFNYCVACVKVDDKPYLMDASDKRSGFNRLPLDCYNGFAREISELPALVNLSADSLLEKKITSFFIVNGENGLAGSVSSALGNLESHAVRERVVANGNKSFFDAVKKGYSFDIKFSNEDLENLHNYDTNVIVKYDVDFKFDEDLVYFNPLFGEAYKENPFKSAKRNYPVEMPSAQDEMIVLNMEIPKGYAIEELPKSTRVKLNDNEGMFEYLVGASGSSIQVRCRIRINKANFMPEDYETLRNFYTHIVSKQSEPIVFKKIK